MINYAFTHSVMSVPIMAPIFFFIIDPVYLLSSHISYVYVFELCKLDNVGSKKEMKRDFTIRSPLQKQI